jgi:hypothetical protein
VKPPAASTIFPLAEAPSVLSKYTDDARKAPLDGSLQRAISQFMAHYHTERNHQGLHSADGGTAIAPFVDGSIAKTISLPRAFVTGGVAEIFETAHLFGLKSCTSGRAND